MDVKIPPGNFAGIRPRTALFLWTTTSILTWMAFHGLIWAFQIASMRLKQGAGSEEIGAALESILYRLVVFVVFDVKIILLTVLSWGLFHHLMNSINNTWRNVLSSTSLVFSAAAVYGYSSSRTIEKSTVIHAIGLIYLSLLVPRLVIPGLKPGKIK